MMTNLMWAVLNLIGVILTLAIVVGIPTVLMFGFMVWITNPIARAYEKHYPVAVFFDRLIPWPDWRPVFGLLALCLPALFLGAVFLMGGAVPLIKFIYRDPEPPPPATEKVSEEIRRYRLVGYREPKNYYVSIEDVEASQMYDNLFVAAQCEGWQANKVGDYFNFRITHWKKGEKTYITFNNLSTLCQ